MTLEKKEAYFQIHGGDSYSATFTPEVVDSREVYEFSAKKEGEKTYSHYGYMTEAFVKKILSKRQSNGIPFVSGLTLKRTPKDSNLKQKIIFDLPSEINEDSFFPDVSSTQVIGNFVLQSKSYKNELVPSVVIKPKGSFSFSSDGADVEFRFPSGELECSDFAVENFKKDTNVILYLDATNSKAGDIRIQNVRPHSDRDKDAYLSITNGENFKIDINGMLLRTQMDKDKKALFGNTVGYVPIIANGDIDIYHCELYGDLENISSCGITSGGEIFIRYGEFNFLGMMMNKGQAILNADQDIYVHSTILKIDGYNSIKGNFTITTKDDAEQPETLLISNLESTNSIAYENTETNTLFQPIINNSSFDFGKDCTVFLQNRCNIRDTKISNDHSNKEKEILFKDCVFSSCDFHNVSDMCNAEATFAKLENFILNNTSPDYKGSFRFGLSPASSFTKFFVEPQYFMKNTIVNLTQGQDKFNFLLDENSKAVIDSCSFSGNFKWQESKNSDKIEAQTTISNSMFNNVDFIHSLSASNNLELDKSDLNGKIIGENLKEIKSSLVNNVNLKSVERVSDCFLKNYEAKNSVHTLENFNSESGDQPGTNSSPKVDATDDLEIL